MRQSIIVRIDSEDPARFWQGVGDILIPADDVEPLEAIYLGAGELISVPDFQQLINGTAERIEFTLSGVSAETIAMAVEDAASVRGASLHVGIVTFDEAWQVIEVAWEAEFRCDTLTVSSQGSQTGRVRSITLSVGSDDTGRSRAPIAFFTDADQKRRSATDNIFSHVAGMVAGKSRRFGPK
ncbi:hypothetical protein HY78_08685 [Rhizorhabdus wittichii DC-6]|nr:hypothetical protein HY78_08685 [Rhizorhabdus wittichii DC-6]